MSRSVALKVQALTSEFRTNLQLMERSKRCTQMDIELARKECAQYLECAILNYPPSLKVHGLTKKMSLDERKEVLGIHRTSMEEPEDVVAFQEMLARAGRQSTKAKWIWRIGQYALEMARNGWYGFFVTLTVDPSRVADSQAMWEEGREFRKYLRSLARVACKAAGQPRAIKEGASIRDYVQHVGVIEHGASRHHHHMHLLIFMRAVPDHWKKCPNAAIRSPEHRTRMECKPLSTYWKWSLPGLSPARYFRHEGDIWSHLGFCLPYDAKKRRTIRINTAEKAGNYIAKYMDKDDKAWTHRVKATRNLGMTNLRNLLRNMSFRKLEALTWRPITYSLSVSLLTTHTVPSALLRSLAKQELFFRKWVSRQLDFASLMKDSYDGFTMMLMSVRDGAKPNRMRSHTFYEWVSEHLPVPEGYCEKRLRRATMSVAAEFPPTNALPVNHTGMI
jgi:hypothetical protein